MRKFLLGSRKGLLLTLATIVLLILMLAQIMTYVSTQIDYGALSSSIATTSAVTNFLTSMKGSAPNFLHNSLSNAMAALVAYESTPTLRYDNFTNNTAYALGSLMNNGTVYKTDMGSYMGNYILKNFINATIAQAQSQNVNVIITNVSLSIYQTSPFMVNATMTGLAIISSSQGTVAYPISATGSASLNGTQDLFYAEAGDPHTIRAQNGAPVAVPIGNSIAIQGSTGPFMLASGTLITEAGTSGCGSVPAGYQNGNYILVMQNAQNIPANVCGMAGLVTSMANTVNTPLIPYLVYPATTGASPTANVFALAQNGTKAILDGPGLALLNASSVQAAIQNGYYYASSLAPSYLGYGQGSLNQRSPAGMFSLNLLNRGTKYFGGYNSYIEETNAINYNNNAITVSFWVYPTSNLAASGGRQTLISTRLNGGFIMDMNESGHADLNFAVIPAGGGGHVVSAPYTFTALNKWYFVTGSFNGSYESIYVNGQFVNKSAVAVPMGQPTTDIFMGIWGNLASYPFQGKMADVQIYNQSLSNSQIMQLYLNGMESPPISNAKLAVWWPLNGDFNDYSGHLATGVPSNVISTSLINYPGNPIYGGSYYYNMTNKVLGTGNPGCTTPINCGANTVSAQLFLSSSPVTGNYSGRAAHFNGASSYLSAAGVTGLSSTQTISMWVRPAAFSVGMDQELWDEGGNVYQLQLYDGDNNNGKPKIAFDSQIGTAELPSAGVWYNIVGVSTGSGTLRIYINGVLDSTLSGSLPSPSAISIGSHSGGGYYFNGSIANVQAYNAPLSAAQVSTLYLRGLNGAPVVPANVVDWWPLNGNAADSSGNNNNGINNYVTYTTQYTNQTTGTSSGLAALHLADSVLPNVASLGPGGNGYGYVQTAASSAFAPAKFTASFWMYPRMNGGNNAGGYTMLLGNINPNEVGWNWAFQFGTSSGSLAFKGSGAGTTWSADTGINKWYFITGVFDGSNWYLYNNATLVASCTSSCGGIGGSSSDMMFGSDGCSSCGSGDLNGFFNGYLADARLYSGTAMTAAQVQQLYQNDSVAGLPANDVWPLNGAGPASIAALNQSVDIANSLNVGYFMSNTITCTLSNSIKSQCGVFYTQP